LASLLPSQAQVARVVAAQRTTEKSAGENAWQAADVGANLGSSDRFRTGKRSKADLKFRDGSLVRLGQLSYLEMRGSKQMNLVRGQLLFVALRPGRVLAGAAAAAIKGSVALIQYRNYKNSEGKETNVAEFYLYSGAMDVITALGTISLQPGQMVTVFPDGTNKIGVAPPLDYFGGEQNPDILEKPGKFVFVGSPEHENWRDDPERIERDHNFASIFNPDGFDDLQDDSFPTPPEPVFEEIPAFIPPETQALGARLFGAQDASTFGSNNLGANTFSANSGQAVSSFASGNWFAGAGKEGVRFAMTQPLRFAKAEDGATTAAQLQQATEDASGANDTSEISLDASAAYAHLEEAERDRGRMVGGDVALLGAAASNGAFAYGARLHGFATRNNWLLDGAYTPLGVRARFRENGDKDTRDFSAISDLSLTYTDRWGDVQIGRQRFLSGPTQATLYGSLVRAGGREIMDAVRFSPHIRDDVSLDIAYLADAFPRNLPYRISGHQKGFYGRLATYQSFGNFGLNLLKYSDSEVRDTTGATVDFAIPIIRDKMEFYGEIGRDPFRRNLRTFGLTFPYVYERTGWDIFLETAHLSDARGVNAPPTEYTVRAYKKLNKHMNVVAAVSHFSDNGTKFIVGVSIGARTSR
jgi:hypothetical protein